MFIISISLIYHIISLHKYIYFIIGYKQIIQSIILVLHVDQHGLNHKQQYIHVIQQNVDNLFDIISILNQILFVHEVYLMND